MLPPTDETRVVRRKHVFDDALHRVKSDLDVNKRIKITFVDEPAVDAGGPKGIFPSAFNVHHTK